MKSILAVLPVFALIGLGAPGVNAQVPYVQAYFSIDPYTTEMDCPASPQVQSVYVVTHNYNAYLVGIEFSVSLPPQLYFLGWFSSADIHFGDPVNAFGPPYLPGVMLSWQVPQDAFGPFVACVIQCFWNCADCSGGPGAVVVGPNQNTGYLSVVTWPQVVAQWDGIGMTSMVCEPPTPVEKTTWGRIKALY